MQYKYRKKKKRSKKRMSWSGKNEMSRKSLVSWKLSIIHSLVDRERRKLDTYSCKYINFGRAFKNTSVFQKHGKIHFESWPNSPVSHGVVWISYSRLFFFVRWLNSRGVSYQGQWSVVPLYDRDGLLCSRKAKSFADIVLEVEHA